MSIAWHQEFIRFLNEVNAHVPKRKAVHGFTRSSITMPRTGIRRSANGLRIKQVTRLRIQWRLEFVGFDTALESRLRRVSTVGARGGLRRGGAD
jgi:hypothetical protein